MTTNGLLVNSEDDVSEKKPLFVLMCDLGLKLGVKRINELPGCWEQRVDDQWWFAMNGHNEPMIARSSDGASSSGEGVSVPPFHAYVEYNGWPAGMLTPYDGILAAGEGANEETFAAALESATQGQSHD